MEYLFKIMLLPTGRATKWVENGDGDPRPIYNYDAVSFFCIFMVPIIPLRYQHVLDFRYSNLSERLTGLRRTASVIEATYRTLPLRMTPGVVLWSWCMRMTLILTGIIAIPLIVLLAKLDIEDTPRIREYLYACAAGMIFFPLVWWLMQVLDRRNRRIRRILGRNQWGSSDPLHHARAWVLETEFAVPRPHYDADSYADAAENCIRIHNWWGGLWAARMCMLLEDWDRGQVLTQAVLNDPEVIEAEAETETGESFAVWRKLQGPGRYEA